MHPAQDALLHITRRQLFGRLSTGIGVAALASMAQSSAASGAQLPGSSRSPVPLGPHFAPRAKRVVYLFQNGAPSQIDLFDHKPKLAELRGTNLPDSVRRGQRITGMTSGQSTLPVAPSIFNFAQHGSSGAWMSSLLPHTSTIADELCIIKTVNTEAINHDPAVTFIQTGSQVAGRPSMGAWLSYGLGSENENLPAFIVLISHPTSGSGVQPLFDRLWGSGFLPSCHQGVKLHGGSEPVLYLNNPPGVSDSTRRSMLDAIARVNASTLASFHDPEITTRIQQYEMAYRMQTSVPELTDLSEEPAETFELYGEDAKKPGTYAANCLLARRLLERGVRFVQLYHQGWDQHGNLPNDLRSQCKDVDQPSAALVKDLRRRGMLDDTLVIWGGEFGRTVYCQGPLEPENYGRDHHGRCYSVWLAGGGIKPGISYGLTDDFCYNILENPVHIHDLHATILQCLGFHHDRLTFRSQGRDFRLTDVHGSVIPALLA